MNKLMEQWTTWQTLANRLIQKSVSKLRLMLLNQRKRQRSERAWWQKDVKEILAYLKSGQPRGPASLSLQSIGDVAQWSRRFRMMVLVITYVAVFIVGGTGLWSGTQNRIRLLEQDLRELQYRYMNTVQQIALLPILQAQNEQIIEQFGVLLDAIPAALEPVHVLTQMNQAAKESGLQLELFKPLAEETQPYYVVLPVEVRLRGDYNAMARFVEIVSKMKHLVTVDIVMVPSATHDQQIVLVSLLKAYRYRELPARQPQKVAR